MPGLLALRFAPTRQPTERPTPLHIPIHGDQQELEEQAEQEEQAEATVDQALEDMEHTVLLAACLAMPTGNSVCH